MDKKELEQLLTYAVSTGADFAEIYIEKSKRSKYGILDRKLDNIITTNISGIGIRIAKGEEIYYASINEPNIQKIKELIGLLLKSIEGSSIKKIKLQELQKMAPNIKIPHEKFPITKKKEFLLKIDTTVRNYSELISQVSTGFVEEDRNIIIANSRGIYKETSAVYTRFILTAYAEKDGTKAREFMDYAGGKGYELLDEVNLFEKAKETAKIAIEKLEAVDFKGGQLPVIIKPGFGAVIFHEACGHGLEATTVAPKTSIFSEDLNTKIASEKVTLIDDGTIENGWGSSIIDDEGYPTKKNVLIENGVLKKYLVDELNSKKMNQESNGCGRREDYNYAPTSRMSNTYLAPGTDKVEDMIKSIEYGVYCERMSGGSVNPATGEFNFAVETARLIENGKLSHRIKGITLIGTSKEILKNVEMVSSDLVLGAGYCGSKSGLIPVTIGQPTIKVSSILVGGKE